MDLRRIVRRLGSAAVGVGVLVGLFVAHQLWGTGLTEGRAQDDLAAAFEARLPPAGSGDVAPAPVELGDSVGLIEIPRIDVRKWVVEGVDTEDLKQGPGHYPGTPLPGQAGNAAIAGHRTTYGAPFYDLGELATGDQIFVTTTVGRFQYDVSDRLVVDPEEGTWVLGPTADDRLTLTTCNPRYSAAERLIVVARLVSTPAPAPGAPLATPAPALAGLSGGRRSAGPALAWGALAVSILFVAWCAGRAWRRGPAYVLAAGPFLAALWVFYDNVARFLPANV